MKTKEEKEREKRELQRIREEVFRAIEASYISRAKVLEKEKTRRFLNLYNVLALWEKDLKKLLEHVKF
jgi:hypothetical protein